MRLAICGQSQWESHLGCWRVASVQWLECDLHFKEMNSKKVLVFFFKKFECSQFCGLWEAGDIYF